ncbi:MAG: hypothetical protein AB7S26_03395 [Sandaracinaceae bacterium]
MRTRTTLALAGLLLSGCIFQNLSSARVLQDTVYQLNDEARWARIDLASQRVTRDYRAAFLLSHRAWGHDVAIADIDATTIDMGDGEDTARSLVTVTWYDQRTMELSNTVLTQQWVRVDGSYFLDGETIVGGNEDLFEEVDPEIVEEANRGPVAVNTATP